MNITRLKKNVEEIQNSINEYRLMVKNNDNDFASKLTLASLENHKRDLVKQIRDQLIIHSKEIIELRLIGSKVKNGIVTLRLLNDITQNFGRAIEHAAVRIETGYESRKKIPDYITNGLSLSLVGLQLGSARIVISANSNPDLFGESLSENAFRKIFQVLSTEDIEVFLDNFDILGIKSLKNLHGIFSRCINEDLSLALSWSDSEATDHVWEAEKTKLSIWKKRIEMIKSKDLGNELIYGNVFLLSLSGRIEIIDQSKKKIKAIFPTRLLPELEKIRINENVACKFSKKQVIDISKGIERIIYTLISIEEVIEP